MTCTFFGNRDAPQEIEPMLYQTITRLILEKGVTMFYVGNHGRFDRMVYHCLRRVKQKFTCIHYYVVLAYLPRGVKDSEYYQEEETLYPEGLEQVPYRVSIIKRNEWMIERSDFVVTYAAYTQGGAGIFQDLAEKKGKIVIKLNERKQEW